MLHESPLKKLEGMGLLNKKTDGKYEFNPNAIEIAIEDGGGHKTDFIEFLKKDEIEREREPEVHDTGNKMIIPYGWFNHDWFDSYAVHSVNRHKQSTSVQKYRKYFINSVYSGLTLTKEEIEILSKYV
jgi:hypothetical protein